MKILIMGLPGSGKTYLAERLTKLLGAVHFNADRVRATVNSGLGFSLEDRIEHARRLGWMCQFVKDSGKIAIADFVCPTVETRKAFDADLVIWMNTLRGGRFEDTNAMFQPAFDEAEYILNSWDYVVEDVANFIQYKLDSTEKAWGETSNDYDDHAPAALLLGRYQPFHDGHYRLAMEALNRVGRIVLAVRNTTGLEKNPFSYQDVATRIVKKFLDEGTWDHRRMKIISVPNITSITYGRDVGYTIDKIDLDEATTSISATAIRAEMGIK